MEKKNEKALNFGRRLTAVRLEKGTALSAVSRQIKVNIDILQKIENGDHSKLPDHVFVKGFIRAYADAVGADSEEILSLYQQSYGQYQQALKAEADLATYGMKFWRHLIMGILLVGVVISGSVFVMDRMNPWIPKPPGATEHSPEITVSTAVPNHKGGEGQAVQDDENPLSNIVDMEEKNGKPVSEGKTARDTDMEELHLKMVAVEETWVKIIVDEKEPREFILNPGDRKEIKAENRFNILIGNAAGLQMDLNGQPVKIAGRSGQVVTVMLP